MFCKIIKIQENNQISTRHKSKNKWYYDSTYLFYHINLIYLLKWSTKREWIDCKCQVYTSLSYPCWQRYSGPLIFFVMPHEDKFICPYRPSNSTSLLCALTKGITLLPSNITHRPSCLAFYFPPDVTVYCILWYSIFCNWYLFMFYFSYHL